MRIIVTALVLIVALSVRADVRPEKPVPKLDAKKMIPNIDLRKPCKAYPQLKPDREKIATVIRNREIYAYPANCARCQLAKQTAPRKSTKSSQ
jgi:hypothetical protein